jgi:cytochrome c oxidase subunit 1
MIPVEPRGVRDTDVSPADLDVWLQRAWGGGRGIMASLSSVDHKVVARRFIVTAFIFLFAAGLLAVAMRLQLARPEQRLVSADLYNQIFTMHGTTMMFLFAVPVMEAIGVYLVPLMVGTRSIAFPRLNAYSYWVYVFGGVLLWIAFLANVGPDVGWFSYVPLAGPEYAPGKRADYWAQLITFTEVSALATSTEIIVTVFKQRAPGMSLNRIPIFVWAMLVTAFCVVFAMPSVVVASSMLISDRLVGTHFFNPAEGGDPLLYQHLFWFFGHPEVYIIFIPATGMAAAIVESAARRPMVGYTAVVLSLVSVGFLSFGLWVHHMFATGLPRLGNSFFTASSMVIAIPTGIQIFCWIATLWDGRVRVTVPLRFVAAFVVLFVFGGMTGVMIAAVPFDLQVTDTYFIVGHIHLVLLGGAVAPLVGAIYHWFPKFTGRMLDERLGRVNFWLYSIGVALAFVPMLVLGMKGMTRRIYTYPEGLGWDDLNLAASVGASFIALSFLALALNVLQALRRPADASDNPWDAPSLEWATTSPPPAYNFRHIPYVSGPAPLWENREGMPYVTGLRIDRKEIVTTSGIDGRPELREPVPRNSIWPLLTAIATTVMLVGSVYTPSAVVWGAIPVGIGLVGWMYPRREEKAPGPKEVTV